MSVGQPKYNDAQRRAIEHNRLSKNLPASAVVDLARSGELAGTDGEPLPPFDIPKYTVYSISQAAEKRRSRKASSALVKQPRTDAMATLYERMTEVADRETQRMVEQSRRHPTKPINAEHARKTARFVRELKALAADGPAARGPKPGVITGGVRTESPTRHKAVMAIMDAAKGGPIEAAQADLPLQSTTHTENGTAQQGSGDQGPVQGPHREQADGDGETPGSRAQAAITGILASSLEMPS